MRHLYRYIKSKDMFFFLIVIVAVFAQVMMEIQIPDRMNKYLTMLQSGNISLDEALQSSWVMIMLAVGALVISIITGYFASKAGISIANRMRIAAFNKIVDFEMEETSKYGVAGLLNRCTADIAVIQSFFSQLIPVEARSVLMIVLVIRQLKNTVVLWRYLTIAVVIAIFLFLLTLLIQVMRKIPQIQVVKDRLMRVNREHLTGIRVVHAYNAYDYQTERFEKENGELRDLEYYYRKKMGSFQPIAQGLFNWLSLAIYIMGAVLMTLYPEMDKASTYAEMVVYVSYTSFLINAFINFIYGGTMIPQISISIKRLLEVAEDSVRIQDGDVDVNSRKEVGTVEFRNVSFCYPNCKDYNLKNISFKIHKGETVAFIGSTGSGKTTLFNLIPRFYDVTEGEILVDGINVKDYKLKELRRLMGYVPQKNMLFRGNIAENISYGEMDVSGHMEEIIRAATIGQANPFVEQKLEQYETPVEEGGSNFSGGQRQRLAISRAVYHKPEIYLFDDSFSALDYRTDKMVRKSLRESDSEATMLIVGQRIGTIKNADQIFVLKNGEIVGSGKHEELVETCEEYQAIMRSQIENK